MPAACRCSATEGGTDEHQSRSPRPLSASQGRTRCWYDIWIKVSCIHFRWAVRIHFDELSQLIFNITLCVLVQEGGIDLGIVVDAIPVTVSGQCISCETISWWMILERRSHTRTRTQDSLYFVHSSWSVSLCQNANSEELSGFMRYLGAIMHIHWIATYYHVRRLWINLMFC